jgi:hypothetical protein
MQDMAAEDPSMPVKTYLEHFVKAQEAVLVRQCEAAMADFLAQAAETRAALAKLT